MIDDEPIMCRHIANILKAKFDIEVIVHSNYYHLDKLLEVGIDAIILDVMMPFDKSYFTEIDCNEDYPEFSTGIYLFKKIRRKYPKLPIIFHTAYQGNIECDSRSTIICKPNLAINVADTINKFVMRCEKLE